MKSIQRRIASVLVFSSDGFLLMGRKDPLKGGVYPIAWHIPGGGVEEGESLEAAVRREVAEEAPGLKLEGYSFKPVPFIDHGTAVKTLDSGEVVECQMEFNRFEVRLPHLAAELADVLQPGSDLVELRWISPAEQSEIEQIPGGREFFRRAGYIS